MLNSEELADLLRTGGKDVKNGITIIPWPDIDEIRKSGAASVDLRLGRWFVTVRHSRLTSLAFQEDNDKSGHQESQLTRKYFVRFGKKFILHPRRFVLGTTLEWIRLPSTVSGYVTGKSSWGRRGMIIETAAGIHPGFSGCLTLELVNVGEVPIEISPGMSICQIFLHKTLGKPTEHKSKFAGKRRPTLGKISPDRILRKLREY